MTFYEALKANETKRVRSKRTGIIWLDGELIKELNEGNFHLKPSIEYEWEVFEEPQEFWGVLANDDTLSILRSSKELAIEASKNFGKYYNKIALFREVPGTREEVKP